MRSILSTLAAFALLIPMGCNAEKPAVPKADPAKTTVTVAPEGTEFTPPVQKAQIPEGAWYCDMGTVHYARLKKGDEKCPRCGMKLHEHKPAAKTTP